MQIVRVYSGDDGESHFEDVSPEEFAKIANRLGEGDIQFSQRARRRRFPITTRRRVGSTSSLCQASPSLRRPTAACAASTPGMCWWPRI